MKSHVLCKCKGWQRSWRWYGKLYCHVFSSTSMAAHFNDIPVHSSRRLVASKSTRKTLRCFCRAQDGFVTETELSCLTIFPQTDSFRALNYSLLHRFIYYDRHINPQRWYPEKRNKTERAEDSYSMLIVRWYFCNWTARGIKTSYKKSFGEARTYREVKRVSNLCRIKWKWVISHPSLVVITWAAARCGLTDDFMEM